VSVIWAWAAHWWWLASLVLPWLRQVPRRYEDWEASRRQKAEERRDAARDLLYGPRAPRDACSSGVPPSSRSHGLAQLHAPAPPRRPDSMERAEYLRLLYHGGYISLGDYRAQLSRNVTAADAEARRFPVASDQDLMAARNRMGGTGDVRAASPGVFTQAALAGAGILSAVPEVREGGAPIA
jgi:hypothetical protein